MTEEDFLEKIEQLISLWRTEAEEHAGDVYSDRPEQLRTCADQLEDLFLDYVE